MLMWSDRWRCCWISDVPEPTMLTRPNLASQNTLYERIIMRASRRSVKSCISGCVDSGLEEGRGTECWVCWLLRIAINCLKKTVSKYAKGSTRSAYELHQDPSWSGSRFLYRDPFAASSAVCAISSGVSNQFTNAADKSKVCWKGQAGDATR